MDRGCETAPPSIYDQTSSGILSLAVALAMAIYTKRDQIFLRIVALPGAVSQVMNFEIGAPPALLTFPTVTFEGCSAEFIVSDRVKPHAGHRLQTSPDL